MLYLVRRVLIPVVVHFQNQTAVSGNHAFFLRTVCIRIMGEAGIVLRNCIHGGSGHTRQVVGIRQGVALTIQVLLIVLYLVRRVGIGLQFHSNQSAAGDVVQRPTLPCATAGIRSDELDRIVTLIRRCSFLTGCNACNVVALRNINTHQEVRCIVFHVVEGNRVRFAFIESNIQSHVWPLFEADDSSGINPHTVLDDLHSNGISRKDFLPPLGIEDQIAFQSNPLTGRICGSLTVCLRVPAGEFVALSGRSTFKDVGIPLQILRRFPGTVIRSDVFVILNINQRRGIFFKVDMHLMESIILRLIGIRSILRIPLMLIHIAIAKYISIPELIGNYIVVIDTIEILKLLPRQVRSRPGIQKHRIPGTSGISRINVRLNTVQKLVIVQPQR